MGLWGGSDPKALPKAQGDSNSLFPLCTNERPNGKNYRFNIMRHPQDQMLAKEVLLLGKVQARHIATHRRGCASAAYGVSGAHYACCVFGPDDFFTMEMRRDGQVNEVSH